MNKKTAPYIIIFIIVAVFFFLRNCGADTSEPPVKNKRNTTQKGRSKGLDRTVSRIEYTKHALCRMDCRKISKSDINDIIKSGEINYKKSDVNDKPCPVYAVQGYTDDREHLRVIFAQCNNATKVITCYNLEEDFECYCPGDEKKFK